MPFIDLNTKQADSFTIPEGDVTIIGAGAAGILLAIKLSRQGKRVVMIETGHFFEDEKKQKLNNVEQTGKIVQNAVWGRKRVVGGTTVAWGGQSLPFTEIDFKKRDWVRYSGWTISYSDLESYYKEANSFMGIDKYNYTSDIFKKISLHNPGINNKIFDFHVSKWAVQPNFFLLYKEDLDKNVTIVYNAQITSIQKNNKSVTSLIATNFNKVNFSVAIKMLIISAGTIESVRILLNNDIGNHSGWLGKTFMEHPCVEVGTIKPQNEYRLQKYFNTHIWNGRKYSIRLSLNKIFQEENKLLNCSASVMFQFPQEMFDPYGELKAFKKDFRFSRLIKISGSAISILKSMRAYIFNKFFYKANAVAKLALMIEQEPSQESFISLSFKKDEFGIPEVKINWSITSKTWLTAIKSAMALKIQLENLKLGEVNLYNDIKYDKNNWADYLTDVCHHMGGTRMSSDAGDGVVNSNLQVWGITNLYICSCSVFPTSSHSNPTLTLLALAARLADYLNKKKEI